MTSYYNADAVEADENQEDDYKQFRQWKEITVYLVDAQPSMFRECGITAENIEPSDTWFGLALKVIRGALRTKIISGPNDQTAIVLYGTRESKNADRNNVFDHVYLFQDMRVPSARRIRDCAALLSGDMFAKEIGSKAGRSVDHLRYGLWAASSQLQGTSTHANKAVYIFTDNADPAAGGQAGGTSHAKARIMEMREAGVRVDLIPMVPEEEQAAFRDATFWRDVLPRQTELKAEDYEVEQPQSIIQSLATTLRYKVSKKRPIRSTRLAFGDDYGIGVQLFKAVKSAEKASSVWVWAQTHELLRSEGADICGDTGATLTAAQLRKRCFPKQTEVSKIRHPQVFVTIDEVNELKQLVPEGVHVLGFKPVTRLKDHHNLTESTFIYPDEKNMPGSTAAFIALYRSMLAEQQLAIASYSSGRAPPKIVALLAANEILDEYGAQIEAPGLQMIQLPFSDDIRAPEADPKFVGAGHPVPEPAAIDAAAAMLDALTLETFYSGVVGNPALQRYYQCLEALALDELEALDTEDVPDETLPDQQLFEDTASVIQAFKDEVYGKGFTADTHPKAAQPAGSKRKAPDAADQAFAAETDWVATWKADNLSSMTVPQLKVYLKTHGLPLSGKKGDIVDRVAAHLQQTAGAKG